MRRDINFEKSIIPRLIEDKQLTINTDLSKLSMPMRLLALAIVFGGGIGPTRGMNPSVVNQRSYQ